MDSWSSHVFPHGPLREIVKDLWLVEGGLPGGGMPRNMAVFRFPNRDLLLHSVVALDEAGMKTLESLGHLRYMIVPSRMHRLDAVVYKERYPQLEVLSPAAAAEHVRKKLRVDALCEERLPALGIDCILPPGIKPGELIYELALSRGKAWLLTDLLMNLPHRSGMEGWIFRKLGSTGFFGITGIGRLFFLRDRAAFKNWLETQSRRTDLEAIAVAHGLDIIGNCPSMLASAARRL